jgi:hypothetical protein
MFWVASAFSIRLRPLEVCNESDRDDARVEVNVRFRPLIAGNSRAASGHVFHKRRGPVSGPRRPPAAPVAKSTSRPMAAIQAMLVDCRKRTLGSDMRSTGMYHELTSRRLIVAAQ